jgi:hypothetical protein
MSLLILHRQQVALLVMKNPFIWPGIPQKIVNLIKRIDKTRDIEIG